jgi:ribosomal protein S18 acetylase RimI-like enzyme
MARRGRITRRFTIREYLDSDEAQVVALVRELQAHESAIYDRMKPVDKIGPWYVDKMKADAAKHKGSILVADEGKKLLGCASLLTEVTSADDPDEILYSYAYVGDLAVTMSHRGQGVGRALIEECEKIAKAAGQKWLRLGVIAANQSAREFYARIGLEEKFLTLEKKLL